MTQPNSYPVKFVEFSSELFSESDDSGTVIDINRVHTVGEINARRKTTRRVLGMPVLFRDMSPTNPGRRLTHDVVKYNSRNSSIRTRLHHETNPLARTPHGTPSI